MDEENSSSFTEAINRVTEGLNVEADTREKIAKELKRELTESIRRESFAKLSAAQQKKRTQELISHIQLQTDKLKNNTIELAEFRDTTESATRDLAQFRKTADSSTKAQIQQTLGAVKDIEGRKKVNDQLLTSSGMLVGTLLRSAGTLTTGIIRAVQDGGDGIRVASTILQAELTAGGAVAGAIFKGVASVGGAMQSMGPGAAKAGKGLAMLGNTAGFVSDSFIAFEKFKFELLSKEAEIVVTSFRDISSTGAMFEEGMSALKNASIESGLSIQALGKIQKTSAENISGAGLGMAKGFKLLAKTFSGDAGNQLKTSLLNLGFALEEQGDVVAKTMEQMRMAGRDMNTVSQSDIKQSTEDYAKNLRTISAITGKDAKAKMEEARKASMNAAVLVKVRQAERAGDKDALLKFKQGLIAAGEFGDAFIQNYVSSDSKGRGGSIVDPASAVALNQVPGSEDQVKRLTEAALDSTTNMDQFTKSAAAAKGRLNELFTSDEGLKAFKEIAIAGTMGANSFVKTIADKNKSILDDSFKGPANSKEAVDAVNAVQVSMKTLDETTRGLNEVILQGEATRSKLEGLLFDNLAKYTETMKTALAHANLLVDSNKFLEKAMEDAKNAVGSSINWFEVAIAGLIGAFSLSKLAGLGTAIGKATTGLLGVTKAAEGAALTFPVLENAAGAATGTSTAAVAGAAVAPLALMGAATVAADNAQMGGSNLNPFSATGNAGLGMSKFFESIFGSRGDDAERKQKKQQAESGATWSLKEAEDIKKRLGIDVPVTPVTAANAKIALVETDKKEPAVDSKDKTTLAQDVVDKNKELVDAVSKIPAPPAQEVNVSVGLSPKDISALQNAVAAKNKELVDAVSKIPAPPAQDVNVSVGLSPKDISALQNAVAAKNKELTDAVSSVQVQPKQDVTVSVGLSPKDISALQNAVAAKNKELTDAVSSVQVQPKQDVNVSVGLSPKDISALQNAAKIKEEAPPKDTTLKLSSTESDAIIKNKEVSTDTSLTQIKAGLEATNATLQLNETVQRLAAYLEKNDKASNTEDKPVKPAFNPADMFALVSKINELMQAQVDKTDEYLDLTREMLGVASDHKNISTKMYRAG
jgi:hypothetical protein